MALQDRLQQPGLSESVDAIPTHQFSAALFLWADGTISRQNVINAFDIVTAEESQLDKLVTAYSRKPNAVSKLAYLIRIEKVLMLFEVGKITVSQLASMLEIN